MSEHFIISSCKHICVEVSSASHTLSIRRLTLVRLSLLHVLSFVPPLPLSVLSFAFGLPHLHVSEIPSPLLLSTSHTLL